MERLTTGQKLARLRKMRGWTQQQLAELVGISRVYVNKIEHDQTATVRPLFLDTAARAVGIRDWASLGRLEFPGAAGLPALKNGNVKTGAAAAALEYSGAFALA